MLADLGVGEIARKLETEGLLLQVGALVFRIQAPAAYLAERLNLLYGEYHAPPDDAFYDFSLSLKPVGGWGKLGHKVEFRFGNMRPFFPLPRAQAYPLLEWGMNWCVATSMHCWLIIHAAVLEKDGACVILPGRPGAGKSTLTAVLAGKGWNMLSDEHAVLDMASGTLIPAPRPISLKNASIPLVKGLLPDAVISEPIFDTHKGTIAHMKVPSLMTASADRPCIPRWVVFPEFGADLVTELRPESRADTMVYLAENAFNYSIHGVKGFHALADMVERCGVYKLTYRSVEQAAKLVDSLPR